MEIISIKDIKSRMYMADYVDDDIIAGNSLDDVMSGNENVRINFCLIIFCIEGYLQVTVNNLTYKLMKNDMLTCVPSSIIEDVLLGNTHKVKVFGFSSRFLELITVGEPNVVNILQYIKTTPKRHLPSTQLDPSILSMYGNLIMKTSAKRTKIFREKIMKSILTAFFCELMAENTNYIGMSDMSDDNDTKRANVVYKSFMTTLANDDGTHRSVCYYADKLCYSTKYLSYVVKSISGRTATAWINEHVIEIIKSYLKYSDKSVKEIAQILDFPNLSFFGKYVKRHTGLSPVAYQNSPKE